MVDIRDTSSIRGSGRSPGEGNGKLLQYSCLENPTDRGGLVHGVSKSQTPLSDLAHMLKLAAISGDFSKYVPILQINKLRLELAEC